jgi:hypothetical protein
VKSGKVAAALLAVLMMAGCATLDTHYDYDRGADFTRLQSYRWVSERPLIAGRGTTTLLSPLNERRIMEAIERNGAKGYRIAADRPRDFVAFTVGTRERIDADAFPEPFPGPWYRGRPYWRDRVTVTTYTEGQLAIDVFSQRNRQPIWHGFARKRIGEAEMADAEQSINRAVAAILANFPPPIRR